MDLTSIIAECKNKGINCVLISDHDHSCPESDVKAAADEGIILIPAAEVTTREGIHLIVMWPSENHLGFLPARELAVRINEQQHGLIVPHPLKEQTGLLANQRVSAQDVKFVLKRAHFIEALNGGVDKVNRNNMDQIVSIAREYDLKILASSDAHKEWQVGVYTTMVPVGSTLWSTLRSPQRKLQLLSHVPSRWTRPSMIKRTWKVVHSAHPYQFLIRMVPFTVKRSIRELLYHCQRIRYKRGQNHISYEYITYYETD
jgi:hypothetical protein